jgi:hypothetical protein
MTEEHKTHLQKRSRIEETDVKKVLTETKWVLLQLTVNNEPNRQYRIKLETKSQQMMKNAIKYCKELEKDMQYPSLSVLLADAFEGIISGSNDLENRCYVKDKQLLLEKYCIAMQYFSITDNVKPIDLSLLFEERKLWVRSV